MSAFIPGDCRSCNELERNSCPFVHYPKGGENAPWLHGIRSWLLRLRSIVGISIIGTITEAIAIFDIFERYKITVNRNNVIISIVVGIFLLCVLLIFLLTLSHYVFQRWALSDIMHRISHELRDMTHVFSEMKTKKECDITPEMCAYPLLCMFMDKIADNIEEYFSILTKTIFPYFKKSDNIRCVIRVRMAGKKHLFFHTVGRSRAYNISSKKISTPIHAAYGIFNLLQKKHCQGVIVCNDLSKAILMNYHAESLDSVRQKKKIRSFMTVPINGSVDGKLQIVGTITVDTYRKNRFKKSIFKRPHIDIFRSFADLLGATLPCSIGALVAPTRNCLMKLPSGVIEPQLDCLDNCCRDDGVPKQDATK